MSTDNARHNDDDFFVAGSWKKEEFSCTLFLSLVMHPPFALLSLSLAFPLPFSFGYISRSRLRTQLKRGYKVSILRHRVPASSCFLPWDRVSCASHSFRRRTERFRELMRSKLVVASHRPVRHKYLFWYLCGKNNKKSIEDRERERERLFFFNLEIKCARVHRTKDLADIQKWRDYPVRPGGLERSWLVPIFFSSNSRFPLTA